MWIKLTPKELREATENVEKEKKSNAVFFSLALGVLITIGLTFFYPTLGSIRHGGAFVVPTNEILNQLPAALTVGFFVGGGTYLLCIFSDKKSKIVMICPKCEAAKDDDGILPCSCGGHFVNIKTMKWVEDEPISQS